MKTITQETRKDITGGSYTVKVTTTNEHRGATLGTAILAGTQIRELMTDHIEDENETAIRFDFGWVDKAKIEALIWEGGDEVWNAATVRRVRFAA